ncbi:MAG: branched-chain amino acid ABC transporter ATP-binding protein/permease [Actinobacteria bacterium]|nr:branched-chain amino acid ABC transporter ATP-binding protein/permease [Actinomycetota bacterium]
MADATTATVPATVSRPASRSQLRSIALPSLLANWVLLAGLFAVGMLYASGGSSARDLLISDLLINLVLVLGFHIFIGNTGVLSFGHLGIASVAAYTMALLAVPTDRKTVLIPNAPWGIPEIELSPLVASLIGIGVGIVVAALLGLVAARTSGLAATMITLAFLSIVRQVAENRKDLTGGAQNLSSVPRLEGWSWPVFGAFIAVLIAVFFRSSKTGRLAVATREDELAAGAMGIEVFTPRLVAFVVSGGLVAFGGILRVQSLGSIGPSQFSFEFTILILAMLVVGGMRTVTGAIAGTVFITVGKEVTRFLGDGPDFLGFTWPVVDGLPDLFLAGSLLAVLLTRPNGLLGEFDLGGWVTQRFRRSAPAMPVPGEPAADAGFAVVAPQQATGGELVTSGLGVVFGGFTAVDDVSITVAPGRIHGLIGPNGAGKTTFVNLLTGIVEPTTGTVRLGDKELRGAPYKRARDGVARTFQNLRVFPSLSVRENVAVADLVAHDHRSHRVGVSVDELLALSGLTHMADRSAATLDYGNQRRLEIARAAALRPDFLLLDEPTSGMSSSESLEMVDHVRRVATAIGAGVLVIDHDLGFITNICEHITVLDQGAVLAEGTAEEIQRDPRVIEAYLGSGHA